MIVFDASAAIELILNSTTGGRISERVFADGETLHAPHLIDLEVAQILRRYVLAGELSAVRATEALEDFHDLPLNRYAHSGMLSRIWDLRAWLTAYDAAYVALAESLDAVLLTCDSRLRNAHGHDARVELP